MRRSALLAGIAAAVLLAGCGTAGHTGAAASPPSSPTAMPAPRLIWSAANDAQLVPGTVVEASATAGKVKALLVKDQSGSLLAANGAVSGALPPGGTFTLAASATGPGGTVLSTLTVHTLPAAHVLHATVNPSAGDTVGVGQPITVTFDTPVTNRRPSNTPSPSPPAVRSDRPAGTGSPVPVWNIGRSATGRATRP
jgi:hypothetical protein